MTPHAEAGVPSKGVYAKLQESTLGFVIDKILSLGAGLAVFLFTGIFSPVLELIAQRYYPFESFFTETYVWLGLIFVTSLCVWGLVWRREPHRTIAMYVIGVVAIGLSELMRIRYIWPDRINWQFVLFYGGLMILCEALFLHAIRVIMEIAAWLKAK